MTPSLFRREALLLQVVAELSAVHAEQLQVLKQQACEKFAIVPWHR
jgi:hypothetical protein